MRFGLAKKGMKMRKMTLGERIRQLRKRRKLTQRQLAEMVHIDFTYLSKIENDRLDYTPSIKTLQQLAKALNVDELELLELAQKVPGPFAEITADKQALQFFRKATKIIKEPREWERLLEE
ncbi:MAG TPA: XRE family transcriptional regulator, partial [Thiotrichaceae bacterium]|nr:XRE family transcriptional regulator [Thiotrichaceae bacterium]